MFELNLSTAYRGLKRYNTNKAALNASVRDNYSILNNDYNNYQTRLEKLNTDKANMVSGFERAGMGVRDAAGNEYKDGAGYYRNYYDNLINQENKAWVPKDKQWSYIKSIIG